MLRHLICYELDLQFFTLSLMLGILPWVVIRETYKELSKNRELEIQLIRRLLAYRKPHV